MLILWVGLSLCGSVFDGCPVNYHPCNYGVGVFTPQLPPPGQWNPPYHFLNFLPSYTKMMKNHDKTTKKIKKTQVHKTLVKDVIKTSYLVIWFLFSGGFPRQLFPSFGNIWHHDELFIWILSHYFCPSFRL